MNAQTTVRARRVNNNTKPIGEHCTLTKVVNDSFEQKFFGFAMTDGGEEVYIPANLIRNQQMTEHDVGAGFTCPIKQNTGYEQRHGRVCTPPLKWDGEAEEVEVEVVEEEDRITQEDIDAVESDLHNLADAAENMVISTAQTLTEAIGYLQSFEVKTGLDKLKELLPEVEGFRSTIDEYAPDTGE